MIKVQSVRTDRWHKGRFFGMHFGTNINQDDVDRP